MVKDIFLDTWEHGGEDHYPEKGLIELVTRLDELNAVTEDPDREATKEEMTEYHKILVTVKSRLNIPMIEYLNKDIQDLLEQIKDFYEKFKGHQHDKDRSYTGGPTWV